MDRQIQAQGVLLPALSEWSVDIKERGEGGQQAAPPSPVTMAPVFPLML
ncbi:MAG: hypothetical protein ACYCTF_09935 [Acidiferrobacter sp.]